MKSTPLTRNIERALLLRDEAIKAKDNEIVELKARLAEKYEGWTRCETHDSWMLFPDAKCPSCEISALKANLNAQLEREDAEQRVIDAALDWWASHRPIGWSQEQHINNPAVNAHYTKCSETLAIRVAAFAATKGVTS